MHKLHCMCKCKGTMSFVTSIPFRILFTVMLDTISLFNVIIYCYTLIRLIQFVAHITKNTIGSTTYYRPLISPFENPIIKLRITTNFLQPDQQLCKIKSINERLGGTTAGFDRFAPDIFIGTILCFKAFLYIVLYYNINLQDSQKPKKTW